MHHPRCTSKSTAKRFHDSKLSFLLESRGAMPPSGQVVVGENNRPAAIRSVGPPVVDLQNPASGKSDSGKSDLVKVFSTWFSATVAARGSRAQRIHRNLLERTEPRMSHLQFPTDLPPHARIAGVSVGLSPTQQRPQQQMAVGGRNSKRTSVRQSHASVRSRKAISQADRSPFAKVALFTSGPTRLTSPGGGSELTTFFQKNTNSRIDRFFIKSQARSPSTRALRTKLTCVHTPLWVRVA